MNSNFYGVTSSKLIKRENKLVLNLYNYYSEKEEVKDIPVNRINFPSLQAVIKHEVDKIEYAVGNRTVSFEWCKMYGYEYQCVILDKDTEDEQTLCVCGNDKYSKMFEAWLEEQAHIMYCAEYGIGMDTGNYSVYDVYSEAELL